MKTLTLISALVVLISVASAAPQWPYRDNMESFYYGYQNDKPSKSYYRAADVIEDDDENEEPQNNKFRQDLKVGQSSQTNQPSEVVLQQGTSADQGVKVIETGSAKPVPQNVQQNKQPVQQAPQPQNNKQGNQPFVQGGQQQQPPAFPPAPGARPPNSQARPPTAGNSGGDDDDDEEEEDSDEEEAGDDEGQDDDEESDEEQDDDEGDRRRNEPVVLVEKKENSTSVLPESNEDDSMEKKNVTIKTEKPKVSSSDKKKKPSNKQQGQRQGQHEQTIEALVPGYITDQGEVLVPFDTVSGNINRPGDIAIIPDPNYKPSTLLGTGGVRKVKKVKKPSKGTPPVVVVPKKELPVSRAVPQFFQAENEKFYYSAVPPPGSIFTFDDDSENVPVASPKLRQDDQSSEEEEDEEDEENDDTSDESGEEEEDIEAAPPRPPLGFVKATGPSGEDDEAESLGLRPGTPIQSRSGYFDENYVSFPSSRTPTVFAVQIPYSQGYFSQQQYYRRRPQYNRPQYNRPQYIEPQQQYGQYGHGHSSSEYRPQYNRPQYRPQTQSYRPQYNEYYRPSYNRPGQNQYNGQRPTNAVYYYRPESNKQTKVIPVANFDVSLEHDEESGEVKPVLSPYYYKDVKLTKKNRPVVVRTKTQRPQRPSGGGRPQQHHQLLAVYNNGENYSFTPVIRQRSSSRLNQARMAKQLKDKKKVKASKKEVVEDPLDLLKKVNKKSNKKQ